MDTDKIKAFMAVLDKGSMNAAAEALFITQPTLSYRIRSLEEEVGSPLFRRKQGSQGSELTPTGLAFLPVAEKFMEACRDMEDLAGEAARPAVALGVIDSLNETFMPGVYADLLGSPGAFYDVDSKTYWYHEIYSMVENRRLDLGVVSRRVYSKGVAITPLFSEQMYLVHRSDDETSSAATRPRELDASRGLLPKWSAAYVSWHQDWFSMHGRPAVNVDKVSLMRRLIEERSRWAFAPAAVARYLTEGGNIVMRRIDKMPPDYTVYLIRSGYETARVGEAVDDLAGRIAARARSMAKETPGVTVCV